MLFKPVLDLLKKILAELEKQTGLEQKLLKESQDQTALLQQIVALLQPPKPGPAVKLIITPGTPISK